MSKRLLILFSVIVSISGIRAVEALETPWVAAEQIQAKLLSGVDSIGDQDSFQGVLQLRLEEGWHTYWRVPGDAGLPPRFDWTESENITNVEILWPAPVRKKELDFQTFAYAGDTAFPLMILLKDKGKPARLALSGNVMVCNEICIPQKLSLALDIPAGNGTISGDQRLIDLAGQKVPVQGDTPGLRIETIVAGPEGLVLNVFSQKGFENMDVFSYVDDYAFTIPPEISIDEKEPRKALIKIPVPDSIENLSEFLSGKKLTVTLVGSGEAIEKNINF